MARAPTQEEAREKAAVFYSSLFGSLALCLAIHLLAPSLSEPRSLLRMGLVIAFFGCLASATWSLMSPYEAYVTARLHWLYGEASPATRRNVERVGARRARYLWWIGLFATLGASLWGLAVLAEWPFFAPLAPFQGLLGWASLLAWLGAPVAAVIGARPLFESIELTRQIDEEMSAGGKRKRSAEQAAQLRRQDAAPPVEILGPLSFRAAGHDWRWADFYKNAAVFGMSGSGKTIAVLNALLDGLIGSASSGPTACSGLILDPKGDFRDKIEILCRRYGRSRDLIVIDPSDLKRSIRWNPLDSKDDAVEVAGRFGAVMQILSEKSGDDKFWIDSATLLFQNILAFQRLADPKTPPSLVGIYEAATSDEALRRLRLRIPDEVFEKSRAAARVSDYFEDVWLPMPDETRGSIRGYVSNMLGNFLVEPYDELFAGRSDATMAEAVEQGKIIYVNMPIADRETMSRVISTFIKLEFYREVLKNPNKKRPSFFLCDEFQSFFTVGQGRGDSDAFERTRQSNHANIVAFQNINALFKQTEKREQVLNLLGNCATKLFLRNTDEETNKYASTLFGQQIESLGTTSVQIGQGPRLQGGSASVGGSDQYQNRVKPEEFAALAVPSREEGAPYAETIGHLAARAEVKMERMRWKAHPIVEG